jgi:hypothetical protein
MLLHETPEYRAWERIRQRCCNPRHGRFQDYGARGIGVCPQWCGPGGFARFLADMGPRPSAQHSIERLDNDGPYAPDNCCWATMREQRRNRRDSVWVIFDGEPELLVDLCAHLGLDRNLVNGRLRMGWSLGRALSVPVRRKRRAQAQIGSG